MKSAWRDGDRVRAAELEPRGGAIWRVRVDGTEFDVAAEALADGRMRLRTESGDTIAEVTAVGTRRFVRVGTLEFVLDREAAVRGRGGRLQQGMSAPMTGVVTRVLVRPGDPVSKGQPLVALEAMKMEHMIRAPRERANPLSSRMRTCRYLARGLLRIRRILWNDTSRFVTFPAPQEHTASRRPPSRKEAASVEQRTRAP